MYKVCLYNNNIEIIIHYPTSDTDAPHLDKLPLKESISSVDILSFSIYTNNIGYNNLYELTTKVKVIDTTDNTVRFSGRILDISEKMDSDGQFFKEISCESTLSFLNDTKVKNAIMTSNPTDFLAQLLTNHNGKVEDEKKIQVGNVDVIGDLAINGGFRTSLEVLLDAKEKLDGDVRVRETNGILYLDWLQSFSINTIDVALGQNMQTMVKGKDVISLGTRIIALGANNLTVASVNGGCDWIEDTNSKNIYGVIEKIVEFKDITDAQELYNTCLANLSKYTQPLYLLECSSVDLSYLTGNKAEQFVLGTPLHIVNPIMGVDSVYKVVALETDLLQPYNPKLTIANFPVKLSTSINDLRKTSIQKESISNGVQVGDAFGIRAVSSDGKIVTTINATEGISIENLIKNLKVFYVDVDGNIIHDGKHQTTDDGQVLIENWKNSNGGLSKIYDINGNLNVKIGSENGTGANVGGTIILYNDNESNPRAELGISKTYGAGTLNLKDSNGKVRAVLYGDNPTGAIVAILDSAENIKSYLTATEGKINGETIATRTWVYNNVGGASGGLGYGGARIYLDPSDTSRLYIQRDTDGALSIHDDAYTYAKISADAITWY